MSKKDWFAAWFDTTYYHSLYKNRNEVEAQNFITKLSTFIKLPSNAKVVDLACGKGRHSITLNQLGHNVLGVDLSENSIITAKQHENETLRFGVHDMRESLNENDFDAVFNLFTSFGYFDAIEDNHRVMYSVSEMLKTGGLFVIDFMNSEKVIQNLVLSEIKTEDEIDFHLTRKYTGHHIIKEIKFTDNNTNYEFSEKVQALKFNDFKELLVENKFEIIRTFGDFNLNDFEENSSDRLIIIARKK